MATEDAAYWRNSEQTLSLSALFSNCKVRHIPTKRVFDILFSVLALTLGFPLFAIVSLVVHFSSPGKVFYAQKRIGRGGKPFKCYKFRTMYPDADQRLQAILTSNPKLKEEWEKTFKLKNDPRVTFVGAFLRKTSLDELPQFWNVLKGDLSIVGPRPVVEFEVKKYFGEKAPKILSVRPGLTGLWQVTGRNDMPYSSRLKLDEKYVDQHSFLLDVKLFFKTIPVIFSKKGAY